MPPSQPRHHVSFTAANERSARERERERERDVLVVVLMRVVDVG